MKTPRNTNEEQLRQQGRHFLGDCDATVGTIRGKIRFRLRTGLFVCLWWQKTTSSCVVPPAVRRGLGVANAIGWKRKHRHMVFASDKNDGRLLRCRFLSMMCARIRTTNATHDPFVQSQHNCKADRRRICRPITRSYYGAGGSGLMPMLELVPYQTRIAFFGIDSTKAGAKWTIF